MSLLVVPWFSVATVSAQNIGSTSPVRNQLNVEPSAPVEIVFDADMDSATISSATFIVRAAQTGTKDGAYSYDGDTRTTVFDPDHDFAAGEVVTVTLATGIRTRAGHAMTKPYQWSFTIRTVATNGKFSSRTDYRVGSRPWSVCATDLDGDGDPDLAVVNKFSDSISVLKNDGNGIFAGRADYPAGNSTGGVVMSDLDNDGDMDLSIARPSADSVGILINNGDGSFIPGTGYAAGDYPHRIYSADFDGNGAMDLVVTNAWTDDISVLLNGGGAAFTQRTDYPIGDDPNDSWSGDLDNDGDMDLAVAHGDFTDSVSILLNNGNGTFAPRKEYQAGGKPLMVNGTDFNNDGTLDLVVVNFFSDVFSVLMGNGDGSFAPKTDYYVCPFHKMFVFPLDVDGDGDMDVAISHMDNDGNFAVPDSVAVFYNDGQGQFAGRNTYAVGDEPRWVTGFDADGDGDMDLVTANYSSDNISVLFNQGDPAGISSSLTPVTEDHISYRNHPDPFSSVTVIDFSVPTAGRVSVRIYDTSGREVTVLDGGIKAAGRHTFTWDGTDVAGRRARGGVYFYRIDGAAGSRDVMYKMILE